MHALPEDFRADPAFDHADNGAGLAVADAVEHFLDLRRGFSPGADGAGGAQGVERERVVQVVGDVGGEVPLGVPVLRGLALHPGGEALVEPQVVPPLHGDHVAEPLVRHLVRDDGGDVLAAAGCALLLVDEQVGFAVGDGAEVLHRAGLEVGDGDQVELLHGVLDAEVGVVIGEEVLGGLQGEGREFDLFRRGADADGHAFALAGGAGEVADEEGDEVGGHLRGGGED